MKNFNEFITEAIKYKDRSGKGFSIKGIDFVYTEQGGKFYGTSLYDVAKTANVSKKSKIGLDATNELLKSIGIKDEVPSRYETDELDKVCKQLKKKGIVCDYGDHMDIS
jgi:hypothetical protein